jgi:ankyrin repeat protein
MRSFMLLASLGLSLLAPDDPVDPVDPVDGGRAPADPDSPEGWTPLLHAVRTRQLDAVRRLLERGPDPTRRAISGGDVADD